jgi:hypothetical protein
MCMFYKEIIPLMKIKALVILRRNCCNAPCLWDGSDSHGDVKLLIVIYVAIMHRRGGPLGSYMKRKDNGLRMVAITVGAKNG